MRLEGLGGGLGVATLEAGDAVTELEPLFWVQELATVAFFRLGEDARHPLGLFPLYTGGGHEVPLLGPGLGERPSPAGPSLYRDPIIRLLYAFVQGIYRLSYCFRVE
jgi:hypothetical protein